MLHLQKADEEEPVKPLTPLTFKGHEMPFGKVAVSFHHNWTCSVASDGKLLLRLVASPVSYECCLTFNVAKLYK